MEKRLILRHLSLSLVLLLLATPVLGVTGYYKLDPDVDPKYSINDGDRVPNGMYQNTQAMGVEWARFHAYMAYTVSTKTPGYRKIKVLMMNKDGNLYGRPYYVNDQGPPIHTGHPFHIYVDGERSFIATELPWGDLAYTKDGRFQLDTNGRLITLGYSNPVMGEKGYIFLSHPRNVEITKTGDIYDKGSFVDRIKLLHAVTYEDFDALGGSFFMPKDRDKIRVRDPERVYYAVRQGYYEASNVEKGHRGTRVFAATMEGNGQAIKSNYDALKDTLRLGSPE